MEENFKLEIISPEKIIFSGDAKIVVLPSYREGLPKALVEGAAFGLPIITTNTVGCRDVVEDGKRNRSYINDLQEYENELKKYNENLGFKFKSYEPRTGQWMFLVPHFNM